MFNPDKSQHETSNLKASERVEVRSPEKDLATPRLSSWVWGGIRVSSRTHSRLCRNVPGSKSGDRVERKLG